MVIVLTRYFKGHMKILASRLYHKCHYCESHYQLSINNGIGIAKIPFFSCKPVSNAPQYSFFCLAIWQQYPFDTINHFSIISKPSFQRHPLVFKINEYLNFRKHSSSIGVLDKIATQNIFGNFPVKHQI